MIRFQAVTKRYGPGGRGDPGVRDLELHVRRGECVALVGPNGAGKSTVLGLALGFLRPSAGTVRVGGLTPTRYVRERGVGYLPERFSPPPRLRSVEFLRRLALLDGIPAAGAGEHARKALRRVGLSASARRRVETLSRGGRQRLGVAQLLLRPRDVLLLDEPWGGLDPRGRALLRALLTGLRRRRPEPAVVLASHDLDQVSRAADRAAVLDRGRCVEEVRLSGRSSGAELERRILARRGPRGPAAPPSGEGRR